MTEQQPQIQPGDDDEQAEDTGFADEARRIGTEPAGDADPSPTEPPDEASSPA